MIIVPYQINLISTITNFTVNFSYLLFSYTNDIKTKKFDCLLDSLRPSYQFFSHAGTGLPGLSQY